MTTQTRRSSAVFAACAAASVCVLYGCEANGRAEKPTPPHPPAPSVEPSTATQAEDARRATGADRSAGAVEARTPTSPDAAPADLRGAMQAFEASLRAQDTEGFLALFSQSRPWRAIDTLEPRPRSESVSYAQLKSDLEAKRGKFELLFDAGGDDCLRDYVVDFYAEPWTWLSPNKFAPHETDGQSVWVQWRKEEQRWVVEAIAMPSA